MHLDHDSYADDYRPNLGRIQEPVISSHFMHELCSDHRLSLYDDELYSVRAKKIAASTLTEKLIPALLRASHAFAQNRALAAKRRALANRARYDVDDPRDLGPSEFITEVLFDRQFRRGPRETYSRRLLRDTVAQRIADGAPIEMVIPALPYKLSCPLKSRGQLPDLAEANFMLELYEIAAAIEALYREARQDLTPPMARFTVVSDGSRFNQLVNEPDSIIEAYRQHLARWVSRLGLDAYVELVDYRALLREGLPQPIREAKEALRQAALHLYAEIMWPIFDPYNLPATLKAAARIDPDPEEMNPEGRFVSLFKSLVFTVNYRALERFKMLSEERFGALYRELAGDIFEPFAILSAPEPQRVAKDTEGIRFPLTPAAREHLRLAMLQEAWNAAIGYIAEIKSDRELPTDPISACLPNHLRWTIHAKPGQLGLLTAAARGKPVQAWAGTAVFKRVGLRGIRLCTLPVLALEGTGAIPVAVEESGHGSSPVCQPLFYIYPDIPFDHVNDFVTSLATTLVRKRVR